MAETSPLINLDLVNQIYKVINAQIAERVYNPQYYTSATLGTSTYPYVSAYISGNTSTKTLNDLTLKKETTGFTISGGSTSKTLKVADTTTISSSLTVSAATNIIKSLTVGATAAYTGAVTIRSGGTGNTTIVGPDGKIANLIDGDYTTSATTSNSDTPTVGSLLKIGTVDAKKFLAGPASRSGPASYREIVASDLPVADVSADGIVTTGSQTFEGVKTFNESINGDITGNAATASKLKTARSLKITDDGTNTSSGVDFDGSDTVTLKLPSTIKASITGNVSGSSGSCIGNAKTATTANKTAHSLSITDGASTPVAAIDSWNGSASKTLTIKGDSPVTTAASTDAGTITIAHATSGVTAGTYRSVTVDTKGHVTGGTSPTTLEGYGITDAKIESGTITLGPNTITPLTAESNLAADKVSGTLATSNIPNLDASKITSGTLSVDRMPSHTHTSITDGSMALYAHHSNEVNFGGTNGSDTIYFGYRAVDSKPVPSTFIFGGTGSGSATVKAGYVWGAVFNDLADAIPVGEGDILEAGYCYGFDGEHYTKTSEYMQKSYIGIHSDTFGFLMGHEEGKEKLNVAVSGFVLAYVDREYEVGTPLTCTEDGYLTEIKFEDKIRYLERIVATYWKNEPNEEWGPEGKKVKVNGRRWVKVN